jgi:hypothetical protein
LNVIEEKLDATRHEQEGNRRPALVAQIPNSVLDQNSIKILDWISLLKPRAKHDAVFDQRTPQTSTLLLDEFLKWKSDLPASSMLCALGDPGAGKTVAMYVA